MPEHEPIAERAEREVDAFRNLWKKRPVLTTILAIILVAAGVLFIHDRLWGIPKLKAAIHEKDQEIQRLETQLTPFRTIALERYPGNETQALNRLSKEISELEVRLEGSLRRIYSFEGNVSIKFTGDWAAGAAPVTPGIIVLGDSPVATARFEMLDGSIREAQLHLGEDWPRIVDCGAGHVELRFRMRARPGSWLFDARLDQLAACREIELLAHGLRHGLTKTGRVLLQSFSISLFANGKPVLTMQGQPNDEMRLPDIDGKSASFCWKGRSRFQIGT